METYGEKINWVKEVRGCVGGKKRCRRKNKKQSRTWCQRPHPTFGHPSRSILAECPKSVRKKLLRLFCLCGSDLERARGAKMKTRHRVNASACDFTGSRSH